MCTHEDDPASNGEPGLGNFASGMLEPLEAQGRGFGHGHKKVVGVPRASEEKLRRMFAEENEGELKSMLNRAREKLLECVATVMYDSAVLPAEQLGEKVLPEPFSKKQQLHSRLD